MSTSSRGILVDLPVLSPSAPTTWQRVELPLGWSVRNNCGCEASMRSFSIYNQEGKRQISITIKPPSESHKAYKPTLLWVNPQLSSPKNLETEFTRLQAIYERALTRLNDHKTGGLQHRLLRQHDDIDAAFRDMEAFAAIHPEFKSRLPYRFVFNA